MRYRQSGAMPPADDAWDRAAFIKDYNRRRRVMRYITVPLAVCWAGSMIERHAVGRHPVSPADRQAAAVAVIGMIVSSAVYLVTAVFYGRCPRCFRTISFGRGSSPLCYYEDECRESLDLPSAMIWR